MWVGVWEKLEVPDFFENSELRENSENSENLENSE